MNAPPSSEAPASEPGAAPLRLTICPQCGYSLETLPPEGVCPECGKHYDQSAVILHGWGRGLHASLTNTSPRGLVWIAVVYSVMPIGFWMDARVYGNPTNPWRLALIAFYGAGVALMLARRFSEAAPGLVRVRFDACGCSQDDAPGDTPVLTGLLTLWGQLWLPLFTTFYLHWPGPWRFLPLAGYVVFQAAHVLFALLRRGGEAERRAGRIAPPDYSFSGGPVGVASGDRSAAPSRAAWGDIGRVSIEPIRRGSGGRYRVFCWKKPKKWRLQRDIVVDVEVEMTAQQGDALRRQIGEWRKAAPAAP